MVERPGIIDKETANVVEDFWVADETLEIWPKSGRKGLYSWQSMKVESGHAGRAN